MVIAGGLLLLMKKYFTTSKIHKHRKSARHGTVRNARHSGPAFTLYRISNGVSFLYGSNDGQKGIGLIMLVLIGIVPGQFVPNMETSHRSAELKMLLFRDFYQRNSAYLIR